MPICYFGGSKLNFVMSGMFWLSLIDFFHLWLMVKSFKSSIIEGRSLSLSSVLCENWFPLLALHFALLCACCTRHTSLCLSKRLIRLRDWVPVLFDIIQWKIREISQS